MLVLCTPPAAAAAASSSSTTSACSSSSAATSSNRGGGGSGFTSGPRDNIKKSLQEQNNAVSTCSMLLLSKNNGGISRKSVNGFQEGDSSSVKQMACSFRSAALSSPPLAPPPPPPPLSSSSCSHGSNNSFHHQQYHPHHPPLPTHQCHHPPLLNGVSLLNASICSSSTSNSRVYEVDISSSPTSWEFRCETAAKNLHHRLEQQSNKNSSSSNNNLHHNNNNNGRSGSVGSATAAPVPHYRHPPPAPAQMMLRSPPPAHLHLNLAAGQGGGSGGGGSSTSAASSLSTTPSPLEEHIPGGASHHHHQLSYYQAIHFGNNSSSGGRGGDQQQQSGGSASACACGGDEHGNVTVLLGGDASVAQDPLDLSEGSRTSTGSSQRSQDSGFSDAGETRKERKVHSLTAQHLEQQQQDFYVAQDQVEEEDQIYECVGPPVGGVVAVSSASVQQQQQPIMPSPIPPSGFGCGRFPLRPASVDISVLESNHHHQHHYLHSPHPIVAPPPPCIDCLSCSAISSATCPPPPPHSSSEGSCPLINVALPARQRRSFSPSALASSSTHTALAALRVPLSCSTPKRGAAASCSTASSSHLSNSTRLCNRIDNFESLNKNVGMNKDNNNNSGGGTHAPHQNKTYTLAAPSAHTFSNNSSSATSNGTAFAHSSSRTTVASSSSDRERPLPLQKKRSAAESIYDKICNRLSSFSSSSSSASNSVSSTPNTTTAQPTTQDSSQNHHHHHSNLGSSSKFRVFTRSSSAKWQSLPRGIGAPSATPSCSSFEKAVPRGNSSAPPCHLEEESYHEERPIDVPSPAAPCGPPSSSAGPAAAAAPVETDSPVVRLWLQDLRTQYEPECLHSLQNKWILPCLEEDEDINEVDDEEELDTDAHAPSSTILTTTTSPCPSSSRKVSSSSHASSSSMPSSSTSSYVRGIRRQAERRSQQRFLSSMTAAIHAVSTPLMSIRTVEMTANVISAEFSKICKHLEFGVFTQVPTLVMSLVGHIQDFLRGIQTPLGGPVGDEIGNGSAHLGPTAFGVGHLKRLEGRLEDACFALGMAVKGIMGGGVGSGGNNSNDSSGASSSSAILEGEHYQQIIADVVEGIVTVGNLFSEVVDLRLTRDLGSILDTVEGGGIPGRIALKSLVTVLADGGNHICRLAADIRMVRGLLGVMLDTRENQDKILALRCLATVLCVGEAVKDFDKAGGFEIIADLLHEPCFPLALKMEAVAVLTQATDPWIDLESTLMTLGVHLEKFILSLTNLLVGELKTEEEPFLLIVAAISNLTFLEVASTQYLKRCRTVSFLISSVRSHPFSVFVLDHVATILANMAGVESCRQEIIQSGGIDCLLHFLQQRPSPSPQKSSSSSSSSNDLSAITACERLQQKSTIALSRLGNEEGVAHRVLQMGGIHRLISLCRKEKERNFSDGVLIAALATLRKLVSLCGPEALKGLQGAEDLLQPRLLDSFLLYSSRQESYV